MARFKMVNGTRIQFTAAEEAARDAEEAAFEAGRFDHDMGHLRQERNILLAETDFYALSDVTLSAAMETYRQALRDVPAGLSTVEEVKTASDNMLKNLDPVKP